MLFLVEHRSTHLYTLDTNIANTLTFENSYLQKKGWNGEQS